MRPDVALNHPSRWVITNPGLTDPGPDNCRPVSSNSSQMDCVALAESRPGNPWVSTFHFMRSFFITSAQNSGKGPQLRSAKAGDTLALLARVYNYSLKAMPADAMVYVRFYAQRWNAGNQMPLGDSVLIGEDKLSPIPPSAPTTGRRSTGFWHGRRLTQPLTVIRTSHSGSWCGCRMGVDGWCPRSPVTA